MIPINYFVLAAKSPYDGMNPDDYPSWAVNAGQSIAEKIDGVTTYASNWLHEQIVGIKYDMYSGFYNKACDAWQVVNSDFNMNITSAGSKLREGLTSFAYGTPYETIKRIAEVGFVPVAVVILVVVFAWEIAQVAERANQTGDKMFSELVMALFKLVVAIIVFAHAFDICTTIFGVGQWIGSKISGSRLTAGLGNFGNYYAAPVPGTEYSMGEIFDMLWTWLFLIVARIGVVLLYILIYFKILMWFIEYLLFSAPASIPFAMLHNKEWSMVTLNYVRKAIALALEGPMMIVLFALYPALYSYMINNVGHNDAVSNIICIIGGFFFIFVALKKVPSITQSLMNAH